MRCIHSTPVLPQLSHVMAARACYGWFTSFDLHFPAAEDLLVNFSKTHGIKLLVKGAYSSNRTVSTNLNLLFRNLKLHFT